MRKNKIIINQARSRFSAKGENEAFARVLVAGFVMNLGITPTYLADIKTVVSEAVTNSIVHGYRGKDPDKCFVTVDLKYYEDKWLYITVSDKGCGIENIEKAMEPFFTTDKEGERSGMGFAIMEAFSDSIRVTSGEHGTCVMMRKKLK